MAFLSYFKKKDVSPIGELPPLPQELSNKIIANKIITFWSSKGGTGKTSVALNTCAYIAKATGKRIVLIDVDEFGDTGLSAGYDDALANMPRPEHLLKNYDSIHSFEDLIPFLVREPKTGFFMLMSPENFNESFKLSVDDYKKIVKLLKQYFEIIAFDCGDKLFDDYTRFALLNANVLTVVADQGKPTLENLAEVLSEFSNPGSGIGKNKILMVINKYRDNVGMPIERLQRWFSPFVSLIVPINAMDKEFLQTLNKGEVFILSTNNKTIKQQYLEIVFAILSKL